MSLHDQLVKLGDMMGDGLHHEPGGEWIAKEYKRVASKLGLFKGSRKNRIELINQRMAERVVEASCGKCQSKLKQTRSGAKCAKCVNCGSVWQLLR